MSRAEHLDALLYAWLSEENERRAEARFTSYFRAAFADLCRYVRALGAEASSAQDIAQQSLIKLFTHLGVERRSADALVRAATESLKPLDLGDLHAPLVRTWVQRLTTFRDTAIAFQIPSSGAESATWRERRDEINARIDPLIHQGIHFLADLHTRLEARLRTVTGGATEIANPEEGSEHRLKNVAADLLSEELRFFAVTLLAQASTRGASELDAALGLRGAVEFVTHDTTVCDNLPTLAVPTNGLLYTIAKRQYLDRLKSSKRIEFVDSVPDTAAGDAEDLLDQIDFLSAHSTPLDAASLGGRVEPLTGPVADDERNPELDRRYAAFLEHLRAPLTRAEGGLVQAATRDRATTSERARVDGLRAKYDRLMAVLAALRESPQPTEEEIARRMGLTRNQVKYAIERIREEFSYFFPDLTRDAKQRRKRQSAE